MTLSLRGRLLVGVISLVAVGLLVSDVVTYLTLQSSLLSRIDEQLKSQSTVDTARTALLNFPICHGRGPGSGTNFEPGTITELIGSDGKIVAACGVQSFGAPASNAAPVLPKSLPNAGTDSPASPLTVAGTGGVSQYRMTDWPENSFGGQFVVFAIPLTPVQSTLSQLLLLETVIGLGVLGATALLALLIIRIGLRPLQKMGGVAADIAAGDLTRRVDPATPKTEIGRLGLALNGMLSQIEAAFAERTESNNRLRRFIADASHELRTPLTSIRGYSEMLRRGAGESPTDAELARRRIEEESVRMSTLVDDMLLIARLDQGRPLERKPVDLQAIAADTAADARAVAPTREITMTAPGPVVVEGDDLRLRQVLGNLVRNALVHTPQSTAIEISVSTVDSVGRMSVTDHGPGLRPDEMERIFEPFFRADPSRSRDSGGAGLGLSIVNAVVTAHGGHVSVKETTGGGATFEVELPLAAEAS
ncbi:MAG TPA: HAMP domain-containing sensor histidine kinase [Candidatus Dormibacteraeota bacterium]|nr:HAMP domain-containing sensor histidine kinase [Candidatus Dormibacteraeota bacterium]